MSRLWRKSRLRVYVGEDHLAICRVSGRLRPRLAHKEKIGFESGQIDRALAALEAWLVAHPLQVNVECVLGATHVRYLLLPWDAQLVDAEFRQALAGALFTRNFQDESAAYEVRFSSARYGQPQLAVFVKKDLLSAFESLGKKCHCKISSMEPLLMSVWNRFRQRLDQEQGVLLVAESGRLSMLQHEYGVVRDVQLRPYAVDEMNGKIRHLSGSGHVRLFAPPHAELAKSFPECWLALKAAEGFSPASDGVYAYALCGVF